MLSRIYWIDPMFCANPWISRFTWSCLLLTGGDKQLYEYIVKAPEAGLKAHRCTLCGQTGNDRSNLRKHVENIHFPGAFSYTCKYCPPEMAAKTFPTRTKLQNHVSSFHKSFPLCSSDWSVNISGPGHSFTDPEELFQFVQKDENPDSGQYKWVCSICRKRFISRIAVRNHCESIHFTGMFKYNCSICQKEMSSKSSLNYHVTIYHNKTKMLSST